MKVNLLILIPQHSSVKVVKILTHVLSTFASSSLICCSLYRSVWVLNNVFILSLIINYVIDVLGHKNGRRTPLTHEVINNVLISLFIGLVIYTFVSYTSLPVGVAVITSLNASLTHLLLDSLTGGVYVISSGKLVRLTLHGGRYDDFKLNMLVIALSIATVVAVLTLIL